MRIGVVGINYKLAELKLREKLAKACQKSFGHPPLSLFNTPCTVLSTCNRTEIYFYSEDLAAAHTLILSLLREGVEEEFDQKLYSFFGHDCLLHLCRVTAGLDSAIVAETEIQGQVKAAYEQAATHSSLPVDLHYLFQKALKVGKSARTQLPLHRGLPAIEHAIYQTGQSFFKRSDPRILFVGASDINRKILSFVNSKHLENITICNRTENLAHEVAAAHACAMLPWCSLTSAWHLYDWIIFGTKAPEPLITRRNLPTGCEGRKLVIDLSVPRNVDGALARDPRITLLNIDQLNRTLAFRRKQISHLLEEAEKFVEKAATRQAENFKLRQKQRELWLAAV